MDVGLFIAVVWRSKRLLLGGALLGAVLAVLTYGTPGFSSGKPTLTPRGGEVWQGESQLLITQSGFPYRQSSEAAEPVHSLASLSPIYASLANGELVQDEIQQLRVPGSVKASEDIDLAASSFLPFVNFVATAPTRSDAEKLAHGAAVTFQGFVARQQASAGIPSGHRIELVVVGSGRSAKLAEGHKVSIAILVFFVVLIATISVIFLKENVRTRVAAASLAASEAQQPREGVEAPAHQMTHRHELGAAAGTEAHRAYPYQQEPRTAAEAGAYPAGAGAGAHPAGAGAGAGAHRAHHQEQVGANGNGHDVGARHDTVMSGYTRR